MKEMTKELVRLTAEVAMFLEDLFLKDPVAGSNEILEGSGDSLPEMSYADALIAWHKDGKNTNSWFSTDSSYLLKYAHQLEKRFGLPVLSREDGMKRERETRLRMSVRRMTTKTFLN